MNGRDAMQKQFIAVGLVGVNEASATLLDSVGVHNRPGAIRSAATH